MIFEEYRETDWGYRPAINARDKRARELRDAGLTVDVQTLRSVHPQRDGTLGFGKVARLVAYTPGELVVATPDATTEEGAQEQPPARVAEATIPTAGDPFSSATARKVPSGIAVAAVGEDDPEEPANVRVWANLCLTSTDPHDAGRAVAAHAALENGCAERGVRFERSPFVVDGHVDAHAEGTEAEIVPLLVALGEKGHSYAIDVSTEDRLDAVADAGGDGVSYAEHQVF